MINLNAVREAELHTDPFDYMVVPGFLSAEVLARVNTDYPAIDTAANHALDNLQYGKEFDALMQEMRAPAFATALGKRFDMDLASLPTTVTVRKFCERTDGNIHTDHSVRSLYDLYYHHYHRSQRPGWKPHTN